MALQRCTWISLNWRRRSSSELVVFSLKVLFPQDAPLPSCINRFDSKRHRYLRLNHKASQCCWHISPADYSGRTKRASNSSTAVLVNRQRSLRQRRREAMSLEICCDGPHEYEWTLRAFFADDLSVNILTPLGRQRLGMPPAREGSEKEIQIMKGKVTTVRQCITLRIWLRSSKISEEEDFYLLEDLDAGIPTGAHAILRRSSSINAEMNPDKHPSLSPIFGSLKTKVDKEKEDKRHAEGGSKALEAENRRREIASALRQPARESRGSQDPGARR